MGRRLVGNDKAPPELRASLARYKAFKQGVELRCPFYWPALTTLPEWEQRAVRTMVVEHFVWQAGAPRYTTDGRRIS